MFDIYRSIVKAVSLGPSEGTFAIPRINREDLNVPSLFVEDAIELNFVEVMGELAYGCIAHRPALDMVAHATFVAVDIELDWFLGHYFIPFSAAQALARHADI